MTAEATTAKLTYEDLEKLPNDGKRYEIIDGELFVNPAPIPLHQRVSGRIYVALWLYFEQHGGGEVFYSPIDVVIDDENVVEPDLVVLLGHRQEIVGPKNLQGVPNLVIEVLSEGNRHHDEVKKKKLYEANGVDEYWIVDPEIELVKIYRRENNAFVRIAEISTETGGAVSSPLLPEFSLDVKAIFAVPR